MPIHPISFTTSSWAVAATNSPALAVYGVTRLHRPRDFSACTRIALQHGPCRETIRIGYFI
jgi:hypothetical protein